MIPEPIRDLESLELPDEDRFFEVVDALSPEGAKTFIREVYGALSAGRPTNDLRPVQDTIDAWYKSMIFHQEMSPQDYTDLRSDVVAIEEQIENGAPGESFEELREELGLPQPTTSR